MKRMNLRRLRAHIEPAAFPANLTQRERTVVEALAEHGYRKRAAEALCISVHTLSDYMKAVAIKAGARNAVLIVARYLKATEAA